MSIAWVPIEPVEPSTTTRRGCVLTRHSLLHPGPAPARHLRPPPRGSRVLHPPSGGRGGRSRRIRPPPPPLAALSQRTGRHKSSQKQTFRPGRPTVGSSRSRTVTGSPLVHHLGRIPHALTPLPARRPRRPRPRPDGSGRRRRHRHDGQRGQRLGAGRRRGPPGRDDQGRPGPRDRLLDREADARGRAGQGALHGQRASSGLERGAPYTVAARAKPGGTTTYPAQRRRHDRARSSSPRAAATTSAPAPRPAAATARSSRPRATASTRARAPT